MIGLGEFQKRLQEFWQGAWDLGEPTSLPDVRIHDRYRFDVLTKLQVPAGTSLRFLCRLKELRHAVRHTRYRWAIDRPISNPIHPLTRRERMVWWALWKVAMPIPGSPGIKYLRDRDFQPALVRAELKPGGSDINRLIKKGVVERKPLEIRLLYVDKFPRVREGALSTLRLLQANSEVRGVNRASEPVVRDPLRLWPHDKRGWSEKPQNHLDRLRHLKLIEDVRYTGGYLIRSAQ